MPRSTAKFIAYDLRPAKQSERRLLVDILKIGGDSGLPIRDYRYVGMGANRFYDFLLLHKYLGIRDMISLEHDSEMFERAVFNVPYRFIDVRKTSVANFVAHDESTAKTIYWLDYDGGMGPDIVQDITSLATKMKVGDYLFVTSYGRPPRALQNQTADFRLTWMQENLGALAGGLSMTDVEVANFPHAVHKILMACYQNAFATRTDGKFVPLLQVEYSDSTPMVTVGGALLADGQAHGYRAKIAAEMPFLSTNEAVLYEIQSLNLTERERALFDRAVTAPTRRSSERNALKKLGFRDADLDAYTDLVRYLPRYVETLV